MYIQIYALLYMFSQLYCVVDNGSSTPNEQCGRANFSLAGNDCMLPLHTHTHTHVQTNIFSSCCVVYTLKKINIWSLIVDSFIYIIMRHFILIGLIQILYFFFASQPHYVCRTLYIFSIFYFIYLLYVISYSL